MNGGVRTHNPTQTCPVDDAFYKEINTVSVRVTTGKRSTNRLPKYKTFQQGMPQSMLICSNNEDTKTKEKRPV